jgi:predicted site-specific integrase-resolvase
MSAIANEAKTKPYMTMEELAEYFGVCTKTIANWKRDGLLVYIQIRRVVRFDVAACAESLRENQVI